jgi:hypothetical protein
LRTPIADACDVIYVILTEIPHDTLVALRNGLTTAEAIVDPVRARETWGLLPEHQAMSAGLMTQPPRTDEVPDGVVTRNPSLHQGGGARPPSSVPPPSASPRKTPG